MNSFRGQESSCHHDCGGDAGGQSPFPTGSAIPPGIVACGDQNPWPAQRDDDDDDGGGGSNGGVETSKVNGAAGTVTGAYTASDAS